jgi:hypothetical protein
MADPAAMAEARADFEATREISEGALAKSREPIGHSHAGHGGCGCA